MPPALCLQCNAPGAKSVPDKTTAPAAPLPLKAEGPFTVPRGQLTFDSEGMEGGYFHSRRAHWPGTNASGVTIGRGYDMGQRSQKTVLSDLLAAGVPKTDAQILAEGAGQRGKDADLFTHRPDVSKIQITPQAQKALFIKVYDKCVDDILVIFKKSDTLEKFAEYGTPDWDSLHPAIQEILVDLTYRGEYDTRRREVLQGLIIKNDLEGIYAILSDKERMLKRWHVQEDRFQRRVNLLKTAIEEEKARKARL